MREVQAWYLAKRTERVGDPSGEFVAVQVKRIEVWKQGKWGWDRTGKVVEGQVEEGEVLELAEEVRNWAGEVVPVEPEKGEALELSNGGRDGAGEVGLFAEIESFEEREVTHRGRDLAGEWTGDDGEGVDTIGGGVTCDDVPVDAAVCVWFPRGKDVGVVEGGLDFEQDFLVFRVTELWVSGEEEGGEED